MLHKYICRLAGVGLVSLLSPPSPAWAQAGLNLVIAMSHSGNFTVGENGISTIVVSNIGGTASSEQITVEDEMNSPGFTFVSGAGAGWSCFLNLHQPPNDNETATCTTNAVIPAGGSAPPITLTVIPFVSGTRTNIATVFDGQPSGHSASDVTIVLAAVPTLPEWAMISLAVLLALAAFAAMRRRTT